MEKVAEKIQKALDEFGDCEWVEVAVSSSGGVKVGLTAEYRKKCEDAENRKPSFGVERTQALAALLTKELAESPESWLGADLDTEICFQSDGSAQIMVDNESDEKFAPLEESSASSSSSSSSAAASSSSSSSSSDAPISISFEASKPLLRYWAARGRAEALRMLLIDALGADGVDIEDLPINAESREAWMGGQKADSSFSGPFHTLPVFRWASGEPWVGETEACSRYAAARLGLDSARYPLKQALSDSLVSATYQGVIVASAKPLYASGEETVRAELAALRQSQASLLGYLADLLGESNFFVADAQPMLGDYYVLDACQRVAALHGDDFLAAHPTLLAFRERMEARPNLKAYLPGQLARWCASPHEEDNWVIIRKVQEELKK